MPKFRKKPVVIEAVQWRTGDAHPGVEVDGTGPFVTTVHEQRAYLADGDWIIPEPKAGRFYPCKPDIFEAAYDPYDDAPGEDGPPNFAKPDGPAKDPLPHHVGE